jgi:hypothetical protein
MPARRHVAFHAVLMLSNRSNREPFGWRSRRKHDGPAIGGGNYQTLINAALRGFVETTRDSLEPTLRRVLREELPRVAGRGR